MKYLILQACIPFWLYCGGCAESPFRFDKEFLFGTSNSSFAQDMGCPDPLLGACTDTNSDWYAWVTSADIQRNPGNRVSGEDPALVGPGFWQLYESDLDAAAALSHRSLRINLEWSRIFPSPTDGVEDLDQLKALANPEALAHYHDLLRALQARNLTPVLGLIHHTLPGWLHDPVACSADLAGCPLRGWPQGERIIKEATRYAAFCAREFGDQADWWIVMHNPLQQVFFGYTYPSDTAVYPPAKSLAFQETKDGYHTLVEALVQMLDAVREQDLVDTDGDGKGALAGLAMQLAPILPFDPSSPLDRKAVINVNYLWNQVVANTLITGDYDEWMDGNPRHVPAYRDKLDFLGVNYSFAVEVEGVPHAALPDFSPLTTFNILTIDMGRIYPRGLYQVLLEAHQQWGLPMLVTEIGYPERGQQESAAFLINHLAWVRQAMREGVQVLGFLHQDLVDGFDVNLGMDRKSGLFAVDTGSPDKQRTMRETARVYARVIQEGDIPADLEDRYRDFFP